MRTIAFYVSGHGFGHASRDAELMRALAAADPSLRFIVRTSVPAWLFARLGERAVVQACRTDTGVVQHDSLSLDEHATVAQARAFYRTFDARVDEDARALIEGHVDLVIGDIPPLAFAAATKAGIPSVAFGNFTWDWIYRAYAGFTSDAPEVVPIIERAYAQATAALRLPFHGGFAPMTSVVTDVPLVGRHSTRDRCETRRLLGVVDDRPFVLASFGAYGAAVPYRDGTHASFTLMTIERQPPHGLAYEDVVAAADVVISKPGYGIVSECAVNRTALLYTSRGRFIEYDVFVEQMPRFLRCLHIDRDALAAGDWHRPITTLLSQPPPPEVPPANGAAVSAALILERMR